MKLAEFVASLSQIKRASALLTRNATSQVRRTSKYSTKSKTKELRDEFDVPIKFSTSRAATAPAEHTLARPIDIPWYQPPVISLSVGIFLLYFCVFREENDIDELIVKGLPPEAQRQLYGAKVEDDIRRRYNKPT